MWSGLSGKGKRSHFPPKSRGVFAKRWLPRGEIDVTYPWDFTIHSGGQQGSHLTVHATLPRKAPHPWPCEQVGVPLKALHPPPAHPKPEGTPSTSHRGLDERGPASHTTTASTASPSRPTEQQGTDTQDGCHKLRQASAEVLRGPGESRMIVRVPEESRVGARFSWPCGAE